MSSFPESEFLLSGISARDKKILELEWQSSLKDKKILDLEAHVLDLQRELAFLKPAQEVLVTEVTPAPVLAPAPVPAPAPVGPAVPVTAPVTTTSTSNSKSKSKRVDTFASPLRHHTHRLAQYDAGLCVARRIDDKNPIVGTRKEDEGSNGMYFPEKQCSKKPLGGGVLCKICAEKDAEAKTTEKTPLRWYGRLDEPLYPFAFVLGCERFYTKYPQGLLNDPTTRPGSTTAAPPAQEETQVSAPIEHVAPIEHAVPEKARKGMDHMPKVLLDKEVVYSRLSKAGSTWEAVYRKATNDLLKEGAPKAYKSVGGFAQAHRKEHGYSPYVDGWDTCYVVREGKEIFLVQLPLLA